MFRYAPLLPCFSNRCRWLSVQPMRVWRALSRQLRQRVSGIWISRQIGGRISFRVIRSWYARLGVRLCRCHLHGSHLHYRFVRKAKASISRWAILSQGNWLHKERNRICPDPGGEASLRLVRAGLTINAPPRLRSRKPRRPPGPFRAGWLPKPARWFSQALGKGTWLPLAGCLLFVSFPWQAVCRVSYHCGELVGTLPKAWFPS